MKFVFSLLLMTIIIIESLAVPSAKDFHFLWKKFKVRDYKLIAFIKSTFKFSRKVITNNTKHPKNRYNVATYSEATFIKS